MKCIIDACGESEPYRLRREAEARVEVVVVHELAEDEEEDAEVHLRQYEVLERVVQLPMAELVAEDGRDAGHVDLLDQRVVDDDALVLEEAVKVPRR